jgi:two-component system, sensor histidine kinase and response regulator
MKLAALRLSSNTFLIILMYPPENLLSKNHTAPVPAPNHAQGHKLLVVDDLPDNLFLIDVILGDEEDYQLSYVDNGQAAIEAVEASPPDLILLDVMMPGMTGYEVIRRIRQNSDLPYVPILLITAHDELSMAEGLEAGADGFIRKPFDIQALIDCVQEMLSSHLTGRD